MDLNDFNRYQSIKEKKREKKKAPLQSKGVRGGYSTLPSA